MSLHTWPRLARPLGRKGWAAAFRAGGLGLLVTAFAGPAGAHQRDFPVTYDWRQPSQGEREIELHTTYSQAGRGFEHQLEFEYGVTDRFMVAPYLVYTHGPGEPLHLGGVKVETRYQLGTYAPNKVLTGLYLEYEKPHGGASEIEGKIILSRYDSSGGDFSFNAIVERPNERSATARTAFAAGYARPVGKRDLRAGLEAFKDLDSGRVNGGPTLAFSPGRNLWMTVGYGFALNRRGDHSDQANLLAEYEW